MENTTTAEVLNITDQIIRWFTPLLAIVVSLSIYIYRSKVRSLEERIDKEEKARKEDITNVMNAIKSSEEERKKDNATLIATFKEGIKEERSFRSEVMLRHTEHIEDIFKKLEELANLVGKISQKLDSTIEFQEKICAINHTK
jgi:hypothetical protein